MALIIFFNFKFEYRVYGEDPKLYFKNREIEFKVNSTLVAEAAFFIIVRYF